MHQFIRDNSIDGYTIFYEGGTTLAYCERCNQWVYEDDDADDISWTTLYENIIDAHAQVDRKI